MASSSPSRRSAARTACQFRAAPAQAPAPSPAQWYSWPSATTTSTVTIEDQVAVTHVDQVFYNPNDWAVEGTYIFPMPLDAAVTAFTLWVDGKPVEGEILDAEQARQTYEQIVRSLRDPALLEYAGQGAVQAHIFPIPPQGERRIELEYTQALTAENGLVRYVYPLNTEKFSAWPLESVSVSVEIQSSQPIRAVYSPSHPVAVEPGEPKPRHWPATRQPGRAAGHRFCPVLLAGRERSLSPAHLPRSRRPDDPDGFFLLLLAPSPDAAPQAIPKDVLLVLDRSGSMEGEKFHQAQEALRYILHHLNPEDRFNVIAFSTGLETYADRPAARPNEASEALDWVDRLSAQGSTDINRALLEAACHGRPRAPHLPDLPDRRPAHRRRGRQPANPE